VREAGRGIKKAALAACVVIAESRAPRHLDRTVDFAAFE
jgi:hypothetical protein